MSDADEMTVDELAQRAELTTRNVRAYQSKGLLPAPRLEGRVAYYGPHHLARLRYIGGLQERGFSLAAIRDLLSAWEQGRSVADVLGLEEAITAPWSDERPERRGVAELLTRFPQVLEDPSLLDRSVELGLVVPDGDGFIVPSPRLLDAGAELVAAGVPLAAVLDQHAELKATTDRLAEQFVALFATHVWEPFVAAGLPAEGLERVTEAARRLRPTVSAAVHATLMASMERAVSDSTAATARRLTGLGAPHRSRNP